MKILFVDKHDRLREFRLTRNRLSMAGVLLFLTIISVISLTFRPLTEMVYRQKITKIKETNQNLVRLANSFWEQVQQMENRLENLELNDEAMRTYVGLEQMQADIRKVGTGGNRYDKTTEIDHLMPSNELKVSDLLVGVDQLERLINLERFSYMILDSAYQYTIARAEAIPAIRPIETGYFTDFFGWRNDPFTGERKFHYGLDISSPRGTPVHATADGVVRYARRRGGYGLVVAVSHPYGYETLYAHLSKMLVRPGQRVSRGDIIAEVGNTGRSTASHLHYEVHEHGAPANPLDYFFSGYLK